MGSFFDNPSGLWALAALGTILLWHFHKNRKRRLLVPALFLWETSSSQSGAAWFHKFRGALSLALQIGAVTAIALALAGPRFAKAPGEGPLVVVADFSARMTAQDSLTPPRTERVRRLVEDAVTSRGRGLVAVVGLETHPIVRLPFDNSSGNRVDVPSPKAGGEAFGAPDAFAALRLAQDLLATHPEASTGSLLWISDMPPPSTVGLPVRFIDVGGPVRNISIAAFHAGTLAGGASEAELFIRIENQSGSPWQGRLDVLRDDEVIDALPLSLEPLSSREERLATPLGAENSEEGAHGGVRFTIKLDATDDFAPDNTAFAVVRPPGMRRVLVVGKQARFVEAALRADPRLSVVRLDDLPTDAMEAQSAGEGVSQGAFDFVVHTDRVAIPDLLAAPGRHLFTAGFGKDSEAVELPEIRVGVPNHTLLRGVNMGAIGFLRVRPVVVPAGEWEVEAPLLANERPLVLAGRSRSGTARWIAFDLNPAESDLALKAAFPIYLSNAVGWLLAEETGGGSIFPLRPVGHGIGMPEQPGFLKSAEDLLAVNIDTANLRFDEEDSTSITLATPRAHPFTAVQIAVMLAAVCVAAHSVGRQRGWFQ